jgi:hypothetical protein
VRSARSTGTPRRWTRRCGTEGRAPPLGSGRPADHPTAEPSSCSAFSRRNARRKGRSRCPADPPSTGRGRRDRPSRPDTRCRVRQPRPVGPVSGPAPATCRADLSGRRGVVRRPDRTSPAPDTRVASTPQRRARPDRPHAVGRGPATRHVRHRHSAPMSRPPSRANRLGAVARQAHPDDATPFGSSARATGSMAGVPRSRCRRAAISPRPVCSVGTGGAPRRSYGGPARHTTGGFGPAEPPCRPTRSGRRSRHPGVGRPARRRPAGADQDADAGPGPTGPCRAVAGPDTTTRPVTGHAFVTADGGGRWPTGGG